MSSTTSRIGDPLLDLAYIYRGHVYDVMRPLSEEGLGKRSLEILGKIATSIALIALSWLAAIFALTGYIMNKITETRESVALPNSPSPRLSESEPAAPDELTEQIDKMAFSLEALQDQVNTIQVNLNDIAGPVGNKLKQDIEDFETRFSEYRNIEQIANSTFFASFDLVKKTEKYLQFLYEISKVQIEIEEIYQKSQGADSQGVIRQPADGSCWLHSALYGLKDLNLDRGLNYISLRAIVVEWMSENFAKDEELQFCLLGKIDDENPSKNRESSILCHYYSMEDRLLEELESLTEALNNDFLTKEQFDQGMFSINLERSNLTLFAPPITSENQMQKVQAYFRHMQKEDSYGSSAELYALSKIFNVNIWTWRRVDNGNLSRSFDPQFEVENPRGTIEVVLVNGNHFNARIAQLR